MRKEMGTVSGIDEVEWAENVTAWCISNNVTNVTTCFL